MAPDPDNTTRRVIDVQLAMPADTAGVMAQLVAQMSAVAAQMEAMRGSDPASRVQAARHMGTAIPGRGTVPGSKSAYMSTPTAAPLTPLGVSEGGSTPTAAEPTPSGPSETASVAGGHPPMPRTPEGGDPPPREGAESPRDRYRRLSDEARRANARGETSAPSNGGVISGLSSKVASKAIHAREAMQGWVDRRSEGVERSLRIPEERTQHFASTLTAGFLGRTPPTPDNPEGRPDHHALTQLAQQAALTHIMGSAYRVRQEGRDIMEGQRRGVELGFERPSIIGGTSGFGVIDPTDLWENDSAFREVVNQRVNKLRLQARGGINGKQAEAIIDSVAGAGWGGEIGQEIAFDQVSPLVQQGLNPEVTARMFDQAARNGMQPLGELRETLEGLGPAARSAHMTLTEYQEALDEFANTMQERGSTYTEGARSGRVISAAHGMTPQQTGQLLNSPLTVSMGMARYGALPQEFGALDPSSQSDAMGRAVDMAMRSTAGFADQPLRDPDTGEPLRDPFTGEVQVSGRRRQETMAANVLGTNYETLHRFLENRGQARHIQEGLTAVERAEYLEHSYDKFKKLPKGEQDPRRMRQGRQEIAQTWETAVSEMRATARLEKDPKERGEAMKRVNEIARMKDPEERGEEAKKWMQRIAGQNVEEAADSKVKVEFTGPAAALFKQHEGRLSEPKRKANNGGRPVLDSIMGDGPAQKASRYLLDLVGAG